ncbi:MAG: WD40/YVTN/BNR-like repeat-containing protein [Flavobacteriaceae bacterium]
MKKLFYLLFFIGLSSQSQELDFDRLENLKIRSIGPANMSGRITAIDALVSNPKLIIIGAASGGVWKSDNGGSAWTPIFDDQPTQNIGAVVLQQTNPDVIWVGTGEGNPRNSMNLGMGVFKSDDGGKNWKYMGLEKTKAIHRILLDPQDENTIYIGAMGDPFTPSPDRGLYKTTDGGQTWEKILFTTPTSGIGDLVMDPSNPKKLFAALYDHRRTPYSFISGGSGSGLFVTEDGGESWEKVSIENGFPAGPLGRIGIAIAPSNPNRIYAKVEAKQNLLYRSEDGGKSWNVINSDPKFTNNRPFYFQDLAVDTQDPDRLYNIYQPLTVSYDGGKTFEAEPMIPADETKGIHADFHAIWIHPNDPQHFIIGGDGGLGITRDHGKSWYFPETIPVAQFYQINVDEDTPFNVYGGMQDNGNWYGPAYTWKRGGIRTLYWQYLVGGDGFYISPDQENSRFGYGTSQNGDLYRYDKVSGYYQSIAPQSPNGKTILRFNWNAGFAKDPFDSNGVYYGSQFVHKSKDKGANWKIISPDLTTNNPAYQKGDYGGLTLDISGAENYTTILSIAPSPLNQKILWVGTDDGQIQLTKDGGANWTNITASIKGLPEEAWIARIHASKYEEGAAWIVVNNYRKGDYTPYLFRTTDYGKNWSSMVDSSQVKGYTLSFIQDPVEPKLLFLGTENGLWISSDEGQHWTQFKNGFPSVSTRDLVIQEKESALVVGTFGRALWILDDLVSLRALISSDKREPLLALPVNPTVQVKGLFIAPPGNIWTGFHTTFEGENRVFQKVKIPFYLSDQVKTSDSVTVILKNEKNEIINTGVQKELKQGLNYYIWKLDEKNTQLPGSWISEESRGIPVLPGNYTAVLHFKEETKSTVIPVIADPRFDLNEKVDQALYDYQKKTDTQVARLAKLLNYLSEIEKKVKKENQNIKNNTAFLDALKILQLKGRDRPQNRQVGAWQSLKITPYSLMKNAVKISKARLNIPSNDDWKVLNQGGKQITLFEKEVNKFKDKWKKELGALAN